MVAEFFNNTWQLALLSAPWLVLGLLAAGLIRAWLPMQLVGRSLGGSDFRSVSRAALVGAPLPLCSCGTLPAAMSLHRSGASPASTTSFLIATPETGVDSVALSWVLLGPFMALLRPLAAVVSAVSAGLLVGRLEQPGQSLPTAPLVLQPTATAGCESTTCCSGEGQSTPANPPGTFWRRTFNGLGYAFSDLLDDISLWLTIGIVVAGLVVTLVPPDLLANWGSGFFAMLLVLAVSIPMYVCATASTPLAHAMLFAGVSPGTVLVFLLAGPASNLASLALVRRELGGRALLAYLFGVGGVSILLGLGLDGMVAGFGIEPLAGMARHGLADSGVPVTLSVVCLLILVVSALPSLRRYLVKGKHAKDGGCCG